MFLLPIIINVKDNNIPIKKTGVVFKLVKLKPCNVAMIFQIDKIHVRKKDEMIKNIARDLKFISPLSNQSKINNHKSKKQHHNDY